MVEVLLLVLDLMMTLEEVVTLLVDELLPEVTVEEAVVCWELVVVAASGDKLEDVLTVLPVLLSLEPVVLTLELDVDETFCDEEALVVLVDEIVGGSVLVVDDLVTLVLVVEL